VDISLAGLLGAIAGTVLAAVNYYVIIGVLEKAMREGAKTAEERDGIETKLSLVRRLILVVDLFVFAGIGYWLGHTLWG
jgi:hypothetical protein